jgi:hypothetical protein
MRSHSDNGYVGFGHAGEIVLDRHHSVLGAGADMGAQGCVRQIKPPSDLANLPQNRVRRYPTLPPATIMSRDGTMPR